MGQRQWSRSARTGLGPSGRRKAGRKGRAACAFGVALGLVVALSGCGTKAPYYVVESRLVQSDFDPRRPHVTETPDHAAIHHLIRILALQPPDVCADRGLAPSQAAAALEVGVLRTRCGVEMAQLERALAQAGYRVVSWSALQAQMRSEEVSVREAAHALGVDALVQVNALERVDVRPHRAARWERRFFRATTRGKRTEPALVEPDRRSAFEALIAPQERDQLGGHRVGATIDVSVASVATGATIWFYQWTRVEDVRSDPVLALLVDCEDDVCREVEVNSGSGEPALVDGSSSVVEPPRDPEAESRAAFQALVDELVTDLARRFAGQVSEALPPPRTSPHVGGSSSGSTSARGSESARAEDDASRNW